MRYHQLKYPLTFITGISIVIIYFGFTYISIFHYNKPWTPFSIRLSDFGNANLDFNPDGAIFFNLGVIITGFILLPFYFGLSLWFDGIDSRRNKNLLICVQIIGCLSGFTLIMLGIFPVETDEIHEFWAGAFFFLNLIVFILIGITLLNHEKFYKTIAIYGWTVAAINSFFILSQEPILEWITVFSALGLAGLLAFNTYKGFKK